MGPDIMRTGSWGWDPECSLRVLPGPPWRESVFQPEPTGWGMCSNYLWAGAGKVWSGGHRISGADGEEESICSPNVTAGNRGHASPQRA